MTAADADPLTDARAAGLDVARDTWNSLRTEPTDPATADFERAVLATAVAKGIEAAQPIIVAAAMAQLAKDLRGVLHRLPYYTSGSLAWQVLNEIDARAELRGGGQR